MRQVFRIALIAGVLAAVLVPSAHAANPNPGVLPVNAHAFGTIYSELALRWAQWYIETPSSVNPVFDETGENAAEGQSGKVWFLAGNSGYHATTREVTVPKGKALFFPIINYVGWALADGETEEEVRATANFFMDPGLISVLECTVDGVALQDLYSYRVESPVGSFGPNDMAYGYPDATPPIPDAYDGGEILLADGYWLLLAPLPEGDHVVQFRAVLGPEEAPWFWLDVTYNLTIVKPHHGRCPHHGKCHHRR